VSGEGCEVELVAVEFGPDGHLSTLVAAWLRIVATNMGATLTGGTDKHGDLVGAENFICAV
jgi:hypothetical protein